MITHYKDFFAAYQLLGTVLQWCG